MNQIINFVKQGKSFASKEGHDLIDNSEVSIIKEAIVDSAVRTALYAAIDASADPFFRRKIFLALAE